MPANFPWSTPFHEGFLGALFKPEKSIFLFDPLLVVALALLFLLWKRLIAEVRAYAVTSILLLLAYISFYARYTYWTGDFAWGDRYVSTAVEMVAFISVPLLLRYRANLNAWIWRGSIAVIAISFVIQIASLAFWLPLEIYQMETFGHPTFVIALRFKNIVAFALGKMDAWGLNTDDMTYDKWDYAHITCWNFLPVLAAAGGGGSAVGGGYGVRGVDRGDSVAGLGAVAIAGHFVERASLGALSQRALRKAAKDAEQGKGACERLSGPSVDCEVVVEW